MARRRMRVEPLEDRRMLSIANGTGLDADEAIQLFSTSTALFVENQGQWQDESLRYAFDGPGVNIGFTDQGLSFLLTEREEIESQGEANDPLDPLVNESLGDTEYITRNTQFSISFDDANIVTPVGLQQSQSRFNYLLGESATHRSNVGGYEVVAYEGLYAGIDLHTFGRRNSLKYEFYVAPGADYQQIEVSYEGIKGLWIDGTGALHVETELGPLVDDAPYIYQVIDGEEVEVAGRFRLIDADTYTFEITGEYDANVELVVDPNLDWGSYLGGTQYDLGRDVAVDAAGNILVTGRTETAGWVSGGWDTNYGNAYDGYVVKLSSSGEHLWSSYLGGSRGDYGEGIAVDAADNVLITGWTSSAGWVSGGWDTSLAGATDGFVVKLSSGGNHVWSTYLGGAVRDDGRGIAVDSGGNILVTGSTESADWTAGGWDNSYDGGTRDGFVVKLSSDGGHLWSSYLGGSSGDFGLGVVVDAEGGVLVTGYTFSTSWVSGGWDTSHNGNTDGFVVKLDSSGGHLWSSYLGGSTSDYSRGIAVDAAGSILLTGSTSSPSWVSGGWDTNHNGSSDGFVIKFNSSGIHVWSTYLGGSNSDGASDIIIDSADSVVVTGSTASTGWISGGWNTSFNGGTDDGFVLKLNSAGGHVWSSYLGGGGYDYGEGIAVDSHGNVLVAGFTNSIDWISGGWDTAYGANGDGFVVLIKDSQAGDFDNDGDIDGRDFLMWQRNPSIGNLADWQQQYGEEEELSAISAPLLPDSEELGATTFWIVDSDERETLRGAETHESEYAGEVDRAFEQLLTVPPSRTTGFGEMVARRQLRRPPLVDFAF